MYSAVVTIKNDSAYGHRQYVSKTEMDTTRPPTVKNERDDEREKRVWRMGIHTTDEGNVFIPPFALMNCIKTAAKRMGMQVPGKGKATYSKIFGGGILVPEGIVLPDKAADMEPWIRHVPVGNSFGGGGTRVERYFMRINSWSGSFEVDILNDMITESVFAEHMDYAGKYIGLGMWRPENGGVMGRFHVIDIKFKK
jgi:hypothetical protein